ncbi:MAG: 16S rRNA (cytosine(1402)-N(4))-methyltransferase RsmH [Alphaproteobacteria bacterium]|nr:16S rRNA (cytosine(1402)-N(4))-methyltransferase RsmH [Alphaproteobacteria bacterium]
MSQKHIPVMLNEVIKSLAVKDGGTYIDATFGNGGYSEAILKSADCKVIAIDRDPNVKERADELSSLYGARFEFVAGCFGDIKELITTPADGIVFDIGVSSMQLDNAERGFSFRFDAPLDMRMSCRGVSAYDLVNSLGQQELADIIYQYGEERKSRQIAAAIVKARAIKPIKTTSELAEIIYRIIFKKSGQADPATRTFQALRIAVNDELGELKRGLEGALSLLKQEGVMCVVTFHSLEDRIVKNFFNEKSGHVANVSRYLPEAPLRTAADFSYCSKAILPSVEEISSNPRSHSAKLRYAVKNNGDKQ